MKTLYNSIRAALVCCCAAAALAACSPDSFDGADPNGKPTLGGTDFQMTVDQETNQMVANYTPAPGTYPIWILNGTQYSTLSEVGYNNPERGTYTVELKLGNRNGISDAGLKKEFTFNETKIDYTADFRRICGKEWRIANREAAHMGCGPAGTAATEWWSAAPNDKKDFGVYDDRITFTNDNRKGGTYTYNAGEDGMTYVNKGTKWANGAAEDIDVKLGNQTAAWSFEVYEWADVDGNVTTQTYIQLAANTAFPYVSSDAQYDNPRFRIESLTAKKMVLIYETPDRSIAWRFILTSEADVRNVEESGFDAGSDFNLWKGITPKATFHFQPGWGDVRTAEMEATYKDGGNDYTVTVPDACADRWQAQMHLHTDLSISAANHYDFSCIFVADKDIDGVTVKLTNETDADAIIDVDNVSLKAGKEYVFWMSDIEGKDLSPVKLVFDFGRATGATNINISNIVLKNHADDDGTVVPDQQPGGDDTPKVNWVAVDSPDNLGAGFNTAGTMNFWWADAGWNQIGNPGFSYANGVYTITAVENGGSEWQAQCSITGVPMKIEKGQGYDVSVKIKANMDLPRVTVKVNKDPDVTNDPNTLCYKGDFSLQDGENVLTLINVVAKNGEEEIEFDQAKMIFDFGGAPAGFVAEISDIIIQKHQVDNSDPKAVDWVAYDSADNIGAGFNTVGKMGFWWADGGWSQVGDPGFSYADGVYTVTAVENGGAEWQAQCSITGVPMKIEKGQMYDVSVDIETNMELPRATVKVNKDPDVTNDPNTLCYKGDFVLEDGPNTLQFAGVVAKNNGEEIEFDQAKMIFDFGGAPAGFVAKISRIIIQKHRTK